MSHVAHETHVILQAWGLLDVRTNFGVNRIDIMPSPDLLFWLQNVDIAGLRPGYDLDHGHATVISNVPRQLVVR
eukprot:8845428-Pyramimonas_sp.AAC.1